MQFIAIHTIDSVKGEIMEIRKKKLTSVGKSGRLHGSNILNMDILSMGSDEGTRIFTHHEKGSLEQRHKREWCTWGRVCNLV